MIFQLSKLQRKNILIYRYYFKLDYVCYHKTFHKVKISNLAEINNDKPDRSFKSFKFSVDYLDKSIIDNKALWPRNSVVSKHKLPYDEWQEIAKRIEEKKEGTWKNRKKRI